MKHLFLALALLTLSCQSTIPNWLSVPDATTKNGVQVVVTGVERNTTWLAGLTGTATNDSGAPLTRCRISFKAYGMHGGLLGTAHAERAGLDVGETWEFTAEFPRKLDHVSTISAPSVIATP